MLVRIIFLLLIGTGYSHAQVIYSLSRQSLPRSLEETSGLIIVNDTLISHNDGGNPPMLYSLTKKGTLIDSVRLKGASNVDWEDISFDKGSIYISETGNNFQNRKDLRILTIRNNEITHVTRFKYARQKDFPSRDPHRDFDCEALLVRNDTAFLFSKTWSQPYHGKTWMYTFPLAGNEEKILQPVDSFYTQKSGLLDGSITSCDLSPGQKYMALTSCNYLYVFFHFKNNQFLQGNYAVFRYESTSQREAIAFETDSTFYVTDERWANLVGGNMYRYNLAPFMDGRIQYTVPEVKGFKMKANGKEKFKCELKWVSPGENVELYVFDTWGNIIQSQTLNRSAVDTYSADVIITSGIPAYVHVYGRKKLLHSQRW